MNNDTKQLRKLIETVSEEPKQNLNEQPSDEVRELEDIKDQIKELTQNAMRIVRASGDDELSQQAKNYWYGHIISSLDDDHEFLGSQMVTMEETINRLRSSGQGDIEDAVEEVSFLMSEKGYPLDQAVAHVSNEFKVDKSKLYQTVRKRMHQGG